MHSDEINSSNFDDTRYVVITPVRNEAEYITKTLDSMCHQTIKPVEWIVVNDGSTDETADIVTKYANEHPWIRLMNRTNRGVRQRGKGVVETFYTAYDTITCDYDFIVKLDGDLSFDPDYFEALFREFSVRPKLGIAGGGVRERLDGENWIMQTTSDHVRGPTKVYRRKCFDEIGGLVPALGWDGIDEWQARFAGWEAQSFLNLKVYHYRVTGAATGSVKARVEQGYGAHYMGYHPLFMLARGIGHSLKQPYIIGGLAMIGGFFWASLRGQEQLPDPDIIRYVRQTQLKQLGGMLAGKPVHE